MWNDQAWAMIAGLVAIAGLRILDALLPRGYMLRAMRRWLTRNNGNGNSGGGDDHPDR